MVCLTADSLFSYEVAFSTQSGSASTNSNVNVYQFNDMYLWIRYIEKALFRKVF